MTLQKPLWRLALLLLTGTLFLTVACRKSTEVGNKAVSSKNWLNGIFTDTFTLTTKVVREDSLNTSASLWYVIGSMTDPQFGITTAGLYTQVLLPSASIDLGPIDSLRYDSLVLSLNYYTQIYPGNGYGHLQKPQVFNVYQVLGAMATGTTYYANNTFNVNPVPLGTITWTPPVWDSTAAYYDSIYVGKGSSLLREPAQMRIKLSRAFGLSLLQQSSNGNFSSQAAFNNFLQGLYITPDTTKGFGDGVVYIDPDGANSSLTLFYRRLYPVLNGVTNVIDTLQAPFSISSSCAKCNHFTHNYVNTPVLKHINASNDSMVYIQGLSGLKTKITIPAVNQLQHKLINQAQIVLTQLYDPLTTDTTLHPPAQLLVVAGDTFGNAINLPDFSETYLTYGGARTYITDAQGHKLAQYKFSITGYIQDLLAGKDINFGLFLIDYENNEEGDRIIAGGKGHSGYKIKFNVIYTNLK